MNDHKRELCTCKPIMVKFLAPPPPPPPEIFVLGKILKILMVSDKTILNVFFRIHKNL